MKYKKLFENENLENILQSSEVKNFIKGSKMIKDNKPMIFYHGSKSDFKKFDKNKIGSETDAGFLGSGFYFYTVYNEAAQYGKVKAFLLNIKKPYYIKQTELEKLSKANSNKVSKKFTKDLIAKGYDGVYDNSLNRGETVVFNTKQIFYLDIDAFEIY